MINGPHVRPQTKAWTKAQNNTHAPQKVGAWMDAVRKARAAGKVCCGQLHRYPFGATRHRGRASESFGGAVSIPEVETCHLHQTVGGGRAPAHDLVPQRGQSGVKLRASAVASSEGLKRG